MALAIFDLDNTLLNGDSDHAWGQFLVDRGLVDAEAYKKANDYFYEQYQQGTLDIEECLAFVFDQLSQYPKTRLDEWHREFMAEVVAPMMQPKATELLDKHRQQGDFLLIITATNRFITEPIAEVLGVDDLLATDPEMIDGRFTGKVSGIPCFQAGKVTRLQQWLEQGKHSLTGSYFYSDSHNDLPLLEKVDHPVVVDGDGRLLAEAAKRGWPSISLR